jgi:hypothetical protein
MCQKFEANIEGVRDELLRAKMFEQWLDDVVERIGDEGEEEEADDDEDDDDEGGQIGGEMEEGGDEEEWVDTDESEEEEEEDGVEKDSEGGGRGRGRRVRGASCCPQPVGYVDRRSVLGLRRKFAGLAFWHDTTPATM